MTTNAPLTMTTRPELWAGPSVLFSVSRTTDTASSDSGQFYSKIAGQRYRLAAWEQRWPAGKGEEWQKAEAAEAGEIQVAEDFANSEMGKSFSFELDIAWNNEREKKKADQIVSQLLPRKFAELIHELPELNPNAINENRTPEISENCNCLNPKILDIPINTLPSTRRRTRKLVYGARWVRVIFVENGIIALWHPPSDSTWIPERVNWPHNALPSRSGEYLARLRSEPVIASERQKNWLRAVLRHELYFLEAWHSELEFWQDSAFRSLTVELTLSDIDELREELGLLSRYLSAVRWTQRAFERRVQETELQSEYEICAIGISDTADLMKAKLIEARKRLHESFEILATVSQRVQEAATRRAERSSERLNRLITIFTAVLFVPTVVSGIYGANVDALSNDATGSLSELIVLMIGFALVSFGLLNIVSRRFADALLGTITGVWLISIYEIPPRLASAQVNIIWLTLPVVIFLLGTVVINVMRRRRHVRR